MRIGFAVFAVLLPVAAAAQTDDRDYLTAFLEDSLSGAGRQVTVTGFSGALSSTASLDELTIADDLGVWLRLKDVSLDWSRSALLSGKVIVNELSAKDIELVRIPQTDPATAKPEAKAFALPELPVSIDIGKISAEHISLGPTVLGQPLEASLEASMTLAGGEADASLLLARSDTGPDGKIALTVRYTNADQRLVIDLDANEAVGGIAATKLGLPDTPSVSLQIKGDGPLSDFTADVALRTDAVDRLVGTVSLKAADDDAKGFAADLSGDLAPLFLPEYAEFFGDQVALKVAGQRWADGRLDLQQMQVAAKALQLDGKLSLAADGLPQSFDLQGKIADPYGRSVLLPSSSEQQVRVTSADLNLRYDETDQAGWSADITVMGLDREDFRASGLAIKGSGRIARVAGKRQVGGTFRFNAEGLNPTDRALADALGAVVWGDALGFWREGTGNLTLSRFNLRGEDYAAQVSGKIEGLSDAFAISGQAAAQMEDLSRVSLLTGRSLGGAASVTLTGNGSPITGAFDLVATATGQDMRADVAPLDNLLRGQSSVSASVLRTTEGMTLRDLTIEAQTLKAQAQGQLATAGSDLTATVDFSDLASLGNGFRGGLSGKARLTGTVADGQVTLDAQARNLAVGQAQADKLLAGQSTVAVDLSIKDGKLQVNSANVSNPQLTAKASGTIDDTTQRLALEARLANLGLLLPEFPGAVTVTGTAAQDASGTTLDLSGTGPGQIAATVKGTIAQGFGSANLAIEGQARAALANAFIAPRSITGQARFDLRLNGPLRLQSLSGPVTLSEAQLADPSLPFSLQNIGANVQFLNGQAAIGASLDVSTGGKLAVKGSANLTAPFTSDITVDVQQVTLRDPDLYQTRVNGQVTVKGPLTGGALIAGRLALGETEIQVPSTGFGGASGLADLQHANEPADVRNTRARAGLIKDDKATGSRGTSFGLDLLISAPSQLFVRGRGLDAELGGELRLTGTTADVIPIGAFNLIRGRLDILGKRLDLTEARLQMQGTLVPQLRVVATTENDGITSGVSIVGPASDPVVSFTSSPELPEEEVLSQLLFGQGLQNLSAFQAIQLASAVATLAGKGGEGVLSKLRKSAGLDNLDVNTGADGGTEVTAGKYISKKVYSEVTVDEAGKSEINLNLDISKSIKLQAKTGSSGDTGLGIVLQKDY